MRIFYDVDTQNDFMNSTGKLYVPDAETIKANLRLLTEYARRNRVQVVGSVDNHPENDAEFKVFPPHCVQGTEGQKKIPETQANGRYFEKQSYDMFTVPEFEVYLAQERVTEAVVYGVATDFCVRAAVLGMQARGVQTYVVEDAVKGVFPDKTKTALEEMVASGARLVTTKQVLEQRI